MSEVSNHPVHIKGQNGFVTPSSLIPFCSLGTRLGLLGEYVTNMTLPVCNVFRPTVHKGQLCYKLHFGKALSLKRDLSQGKDSGITMIIDTYNEKFVELQGEILKSKLLSDAISFVNINKNYKNPAQIHIGTLAPFTGYGPGDYQLFSLKQITGTQSFLAKPDNEKACTNEKFEECQIRKAREQNMACDCKPFKLTSAFTDNQV